MSFKRVFAPHIVLQDNSLTSALIGIGFRFGGQMTTVPPNIEDVLFYASLEGLKKPDYRILSLLMDWLSLHAEVVNVDRLTHLVSGHHDSRLRSFWTAVAQWKKTDSRWKKLGKLALLQRQDLLEFGTDFLVSKHGEDERFRNTCLRVPKLTLRERKEDILSPEELAAIHRSYYYRLMIGPTYRADMWAYLEGHPKAEASEVARSAYGSFSTAWEVKKDFIRVTLAETLMSRALQKRIQK